LKPSQLGSLVLALALFACGPKKPSESPVPPVAMRGVLRSTADLAPPFTVQQRIHGKYAGGDATIDCVVQLQDGKLTVVGLTPFGSRAFVIQQTGVEVKFEKYIDRDLPVEPEAVLYDIHRVFFRQLPPRTSDGVSEGQDEMDLVHERWVDGHIVERRFQSMEGPVNNLVVVTFSGPPAPVIAPKVRITSSAYAYTLEIENTEQKTLGGNYTLEVETAPVPVVPVPVTP
jgi:hypothetical protein